jgi:hypothetical protein
VEAGVFPVNYVFNCPLEHQPVGLAALNRIQRILPARIASIFEFGRLAEMPALSDDNISML